MSGTLARDNVRAAWGEEAPDWVIALAEACDESSQNQAARRTGYSAATVNQVLKRSYKGDLNAVRQAVEGVFGQAVVDCPILGEISTTACIGHQRRGLRPTNPQRVKLFRACRNGCPHSRLPGAR